MKGRLAQWRGWRRCRDAAPDSDWQTTTAGLYVCDAWIIPGPWGQPPALTLLCLGKRLGQQLDG